MAKKPKVSNSSINPFAAATVVITVGAVGLLGIWGQLKSPPTNTPIKQETKPLPVAASQVNYAYAPIVDYTKFPETPSAAASTVLAASAASSSASTNSSDAPQKMETPVKKEAEKKQTDTVLKQTSPKILSKPVPAKTIEPKQVKTPDLKASSVAASSPEAQKPKTSDFSYVQPVAATASSATPKQALTATDVSRAVTIPKVKAFEPTVLESSGDRVWIKVTPTSTAIIEVGKELPGYGKLLKISGKEASFEKGIIHANENNQK